MSSASDGNGKKGPMTGEVRSAALSHIGASPNRTLLEDRARVGQINTAGGTSMTLGVVADGVGGENAGERAAELTVTTVFDYCESTTSQDIPAVLKSALEKANERVHAEARRSRRKMNMGSTAAVAAIVDSCLYLANVGDSRIYLLRDGEATQLTIDHTWANEVVRSGKLSPEDANKHPRREEIVRSIGSEARVDVDLGIWLQGGEEGDAAARSAQGLELQPGDRVLICSDGVTKSRHNNPAAHYVEVEELSELTRGREPEKAVQEIIQCARSREVDDNVSAVVMEIPSGKLRKLPLAIPLIVAVAIVLIAIGAWLAFRKPPTPIDEVTQVQPELPPLPVGFAFLSQLEGMAELQTSGGEFHFVEVEDIIPSGQGVHIRTLGEESALRLDMADGSFLYMGPETQIEFRFIADDTSSETFIILEHGIVLVSSGEGGDRTFAVASPIGITATVSSSLMGVLLDPMEARLHVDCFEGTCVVEGLGRVSLSEGQYLWMNDIGEMSPIEQVRFALYAFSGDLAESPEPTSTVMEPTSRPDLPTDTLEPLFVPPTASATPKPSVKPPTPTHTQTFTPTITQTNTSTPTETDTPTETHTPTKTPKPTRTDKPTETDEPTNTPTDAPTNTPEATATNGG
ncbi:MAG: SpoIIE family protein phosphatase [Anaerolineales bacterium]|nr:SpoIIE family protein phosphatase [Anaerolineales bacterium]